MRPVLGVRRTGERAVGVGAGRPGRDQEQNADAERPLPVEARHGHGGGRGEHRHAHLIHLAHPDHARHERHQGIPGAIAREVVDIARERRHQRMRARGMIAPPLPGEERRELHEARALAWTAVSARGEDRYDSWCRRTAHGWPLSVLQLCSSEGAGGQS
jgi:hypothetical protein